MLAIRLPEEIEQRLTDLAQRTGRTKTFYVREAILKHLEDLEDAYLAETAFEDFVKSGKSAIPLGDVEKSLGLDD
jgi:RHH-type transcriptional regulator, rel operon repressor / antitoxin RelB